MVRYIDLTLRSKEKPQSSSAQSRIGPVMDVAGAVEQHVDRPELARPARRSPRVERRRAGASRRLEAGERRRVDVGGDHPRALGGEAPRRWRGRCPAAAAVSNATFPSSLPAMVLLRSLTRADQVALGFACDRSAHRHARRKNGRRTKGGWRADCPIQALRANSTGDPPNRLCRLGWKRSDPAKARRETNMTARSAALQSACGRSLLARLYRRRRRD